MRQDFPFSIFGLALRLYEHAARGVPARPTATSIFLCLLKFSIFSHLFWWQWTYFKYNRIFAATSLVAMNLQSNIFQPSLGWQWTYNRILFSHLFGGIVESVRWQSELCNIHISLVAHLSIWLVAQNFQCPRNFCVFCGSIFRHRQATLLTLISYKEGNTKKQRLAARGNICANKDLQHFLVLAFQHLHGLPLLFESSVIN